MDSCLCHVVVTPRRGRRTGLYECMPSIRWVSALTPKETLRVSVRQESETSSSEDERDDGPFFIIKPDAGCKGRVRACGVPGAHEQTH